GERSGAPRSVWSMWAPIETPWASLPRRAPGPGLTVARVGSGGVLVDEPLWAAASVQTDCFHGRASFPGREVGSPTHQRFGSPSFSCMRCDFDPEPIP